MVRRISCTLGILTASAVSVLAVRGSQKPYSPEAPSYRQKGPADAPVTLVEFSDFKHFPLTRMHPKAKTAAIAAECAGRQDRFWDFHDKLYANQADWVKDKGKTFEDYARELGLDQAAFAACLKDPSVPSVIEQDMKEADDRWVGSTPTFFINSKRFVGARQLTDRGVIWTDKILKKHGKS
jgi:protein-disulfide isomerase